MDAYTKGCLIIGTWLTGALVCRSILTEENWANLAKSEAEARAKSPETPDWAYRAARVTAFLLWPLVGVFCAVCGLLTGLLNLLGKLGDPPPPPPAGGGAGA